MTFLLWFVVVVILAVIFLCANIWMGELVAVVGAGEEANLGVYGLLAFSFILSILYSWAVYSLLV